MWFADAGLCKLFTVTVQAGFAFFFPPFSRVPSLASFFFSIIYFFFTFMFLFQPLPLKLWCCPGVYDRELL